MDDFAERLRNDPLNKASQAPLCPPTKAATTLSALPSPPPGYGRPHSWDQLWLHRHDPGRILLSTHLGWEGIDGLVLLDTVRRVRDVDEMGNRYKLKTIPWERVKPGVVIFHGTEMEVGLVSLRIPGAGGRERRHG